MTRGPHGGCAGPVGIALSAGLPHGRRRRRRLRPPRFTRNTRRRLGPPRGLDFRNTFINLCLPSAPRGGGPPAAGRGAAPGARGQGAAGRAAAPQTPDRANWYAPPFKVFDNLYWLGTRQHSSWALQTSDGLIIIDTNFAWATEPEIIDGLTKLGLNPSDIKYVVISHAHGDHDQGAAELQERYGAKVVMGAPDWDATLSVRHRRGRCAEARHLVGPEGMKLTLGDTTVESSSRRATRPERCRMSSR